MQKLVVVCGFLFLMAMICTSPSAYADVPDHPIMLAQQQQGSASETNDEDEEDFEEDYEDDEEFEEEGELIPDPLERLNREFYGLNNALYYALLKPVSQGYGFIVPEEIRGAIKNMFYNIRFPIRFINCLLQGKGGKAVAEFNSFFLNTTVGFLGMANAASSYPGLNPSPEDFGQTLAVWQVHSGAYLMLPILGPSSFRHGTGMVADTFLDPIWWLVEDWRHRIYIKAFETVNATSLRIGDYEALTDAALDPYIAIRNAWVQHRNKLIAE
jgi:phospholipid-binding lipoprotein MlaA